MSDEEQVDHPEHYGGDTTYEAIKVIEAWGLGFHLGNSAKYICRAGKKNPSAELEDLKKARWYLDRKIQQLTEENSPKLSELRLEDVLSSIMAGESWCKCNPPPRTNVAPSGYLYCEGCFSRISL